MDKFKNDSFAVWYVPDNLGINDRLTAFENAYIENSFPDDFKIPLDLSEQKFVVIGLNPGSAGVSSKSPFLNFHGKSESVDYKLAAIFYETNIWGSYMTDAIPYSNESDSSKVKVGGQTTIDELESRLDDLGIPDDAVLILLGSKLRDLWKEPNSKFKRSVAFLGHYSYKNKSWNFETERSKAKSISYGHVDLKGNII